MRHVIASGEIDFFTETAGSQVFDSPSVAGGDTASAELEKAFLTLSITDGRSAGATILLERYEDKIWATSPLSSDSDTVFSIG
jgi:hypothetical protein